MESVLQVNKDLLRQMDSLGPVNVWSWAKGLIPILLDFIPRLGVRACVCPRACVSVCTCMWGCVVAWANICVCMNADAHMPMPGNRVFRTCNVPVFLCLRDIIAWMDGSECAIETFRFMLRVDLWSDMRVERAYVWLVAVAPPGRCTANTVQTWTKAVSCLPG